MVFSSATFLFAFMPLFFVAYFVIPGRKAKNVLLLLASLFFYAWGEPVYILLMLASIAANWLFGLKVGPRRGAAAKGEEALEKAPRGKHAATKCATPPPEWRKHW